AIERARDVMIEPIPRAGAGEGYYTRRAYACAFQPLELALHPRSCDVRVDFEFHVVQHRPFRVNREDVFEGSPAEHQPRCNLVVRMDNAPDEGGTLQTFAQPPGIPAQLDEQADVACIQLLRGRLL